MNKKTLRIAGWALGLSMAVAGIGVAVGTSHFTNGSDIAMVEAAGTETTFTTTNSGGFTDNSKTTEGVTCDIDINGGSWQEGHVRVFAGGSVHLSTTDIITKVVFTYARTQTWQITAGDGEFSADWTTWTGSTNELSVTNNASAQFRIQSIVVTHAPASAEKYSISFNSNGGTGTMAGLSDQSGTYKLPACSFTAPSGKAFAGWKADNSGDLLPVNHSYSLTSDVEFYAQWVNAYSVTYLAGEHGSGSFAVSNQAEGTYTLLDFEDLEGISASSGYRFTNYTVNDVDKDPGDTITLNANTTITVNFEAIPINTTYDFIKGFGWTTAYGEHTVDGKTQADGDYGATISFSRANMQSTGVGSDRPFCAVNNTNENQSFVFTLTEEGYKIKGVTVTFIQRGSQTPTFKLYKGSSIGQTPLDTAVMGTKSTLSAANLNDTQFCVSLTGTSSNNEGGALTSIYIELEELADFGTLDHIAVTSFPNVVYHVGETYSTSGLVVTAYDGANEATANFKDVTASISALLENDYEFEESDVPGIENEIEYTEGNVTKSTSFNVDVYALAEYELVASAPDDWSGNYLIVGTSGVSDLVAMNGGLLNPDVEGGYKGVEEKTAGVIEAGQELEWTVAATAGGYSIQGKSGKYIGSLTSANNGMLVGDDAITNSLDLSGSSVVITGTNGYKLRFNTTGQGRFRYYSGDYSVKLYKLKVSDNADAFATTFMSAFSCDASGTNKPSFAIKEGETRWTWALLAAEYDTLTNSEKEQFRTGVASEAGTNIQQALARYDYIVGKYLKGGLDNTFTDFMSRNPSPIAGAYNVSIETKNHDIDSLLVISGASIAIATLGGIFLISRRRREE